MRVLPIAVSLLVVVASASSPPALGANSMPGLPSSTAKVCRLIPSAELERALNAKITHAVGRDDPTLSACTAYLGAKIAAVVNWSKPGTPGLPTDNDTMLAMPRAMASQGQKVVMEKDAEVACFGLTVGSKVAPPGPKAAWTSTCGNVHGYMVFSVAGGDTMVPFATLRRLLAAAMHKL